MGVDSLHRHNRLIRLAEASEVLRRSIGSVSPGAAQLCAHFDHPDVSNGPTENLNLKIKNAKRTARGYRNFDH